MSCAQLGALVPCAMVPPGRRVAGHHCVFLFDISGGGGAVDDDAAGELASRLQERRRSVVGAGL